MELKITSNNRHLGPLLNGSKIEGVLIRFEPHVISRDMNVSITGDFDVNITIDLTKVTYALVAAWIARNFKNKGTINIYPVNDSIDEREAAKMIEQKINNQEADSTK